jgi:hypothetical protein
MSAICQKLPRSVAEEMLQVVARAMCDRPGDNPAQRESRTRQMVYSTMGLDPRDGLEYMLTTMAIGHFNLILDSMFDVFQGQMDTLKARTKTTIVALDRSMLAFVKEMRLARERPVVQSAEELAAEARSMAEPSEEPVAEEPEVAAIAVPAGIVPPQFDAGGLEEHVPAFQGALKTAVETLAAARALDDGDAKAAAGD